MLIAEVTVHGLSAVTKINESLPVGASGLKVRFKFVDPIWKTLSKTVVFRNKNTSMDAIIVNDCATIPHEILSSVLDVVEVGVYGTDSSNSLAIPTIWTQLGTVCSATKPSGKVSSERTLPYWAQIKEQVDSMQNTMMDQDDLEFALKQAKLSGAFNGPKGEQGAPGMNGKDGYSPIAGKDYWTADDQNRIIEETEKAVVNAFSGTTVIIGEATGKVAALRDSANREIRGINIYGKTVQNGEPTPDTPIPLESVGNDGTIKMIVSALFNPANVKRDYWLTDNGDGTDAAHSGWYVSEYIPVEGGKQYTISGKTQGQSTCFYDENRVYLSATNLVNGTMTVPNGVAYMRINGVISELYKTQVYCADNPNQPLTAQTPKGLSGIPVSSGGNYTDENGQMWACDEIDFARGKYVQRIAHHYLDGSIAPNQYLNIGGHMRFGWNTSEFLIAPSNFQSISLQRCNRFTPSKSPLGINEVDGAIGTYTGGGIYVRYDAVTSKEAMVEYLTENPVEYIYVMKTPIETDLTEEEIAQYSDLHTYYPNTTIYNDSGAGMKVKYLADTKMYIDNKFAELASAILNA